MSARLAFLLLLFSYFFSGCIGLYDDIVDCVDRAQCNLRVGILSDTHLNLPSSDEEVDNSYADELFLKTLTYFSQRGVDAVVIAGDVTDGGSVRIRRSIKEMWNQVFPGGMRDGDPVELIVVTGENDTPQVYESLMGEEFVPVFARDVKGYLFIGANWYRKSGVDAWALKPLLERVDRTQPFFYIQNLVPYATCCPQETQPSVFDGGKVSYMLSRFPNAVAICGRSHTPLSDDSAFWRGDFTCVNAGSFSYMKTRDGRAWHTLPNESAMPRSYRKAGGDGGFKRSSAHHGLVMSVYDTSIVFERLDFGHEVKEFAHPDQLFFEKVGSDWEIALPTYPEPCPVLPEPQFWEDTRLMVFPSDDAVLVRVPPILAKYMGTRAYAYEVRCSSGPEGAGGREIVKTVYSPAFCLNEERETLPVTCRFSRDELPKGWVRVSVTPVDAFGRAGRPISDEVNL